MSPAFPWLRWGALLWLAVWVPCYWKVWGWRNFLHICDIAVILTCVGLWRGSALLLSSQAVSSVAVDLAWSADFGWRWLFGKHLVGGTEYMWDARFPYWVRLLSGFHVFWPALLTWSLYRVGYDRRGWAVQSGIAATVLVASRFIEPALNINFTHRDPIFSHSWGAAPIHVAVVLLGLVGIIYWPTHRVLAALLPDARETSRRPRQKD